MRLEQVGDDTLVKINTVGASEAEASILLTDILASSLSAADFVL